MTRLHRALTTPVLLLAALAAVGVLATACGTAGAASIGDVEQVRQQLDALQAEVQALRQENRDPQDRLAQQQRVVAALLTRVEPDAQFALTTHITGFEDPAGATNPRLEVHQGDLVRLELTNGEDLEHDLVIDGLAHSAHLTRAGATTAVVFVADQAGEYAYYCSIPGHREAGMEGTLVVQAGEGGGHHDDDHGDHTH